MRPRELGRRGIALGAIVLVPMAASAMGTLRSYGLATARRVYEIAMWRAPGEVLGASSFVAFSVACVTVAGLALALSAFRVARGRDVELERPYTLLRGLTLLHGAAGPFLALSATNHLSPTVRGRAVLARYFSVVLEHQAFLAFATAAVGLAWVVGCQPSWGAKPARELLPRLAAAWSVLVAFALSGVACRVLAGTFAEAGAATVIPTDVPRTMEVEVGVALTAITLALVLSALVVHRSLPAEPAPDDDAPPKKALALLPRTAATVLLPLLSLTIASWASSRPCDPDPSDLSGAPTVAAIATRPLPLARAGATPSPEEGVLVADAAKRVRDIWPKAGAHDVRLVVQRDVFDRGRSGVFARFGDGRFGVLRMSFADRDDGTVACKAPTPRRCVDVAHGAALASVAPWKEGEGAPAFIYHADTDETVGELAHDVAALAKLTYEIEKTSAKALDVDVLIVLPPPPHDTQLASKSQRAPVRARAPMHGSDEASTVLPSPGCGGARAAASFERHELPVDGVTRRVFVSAPASAEGPRSLVVVLHGNGSGADDIRRALPLEARLGATSVLLYPEARSGLWDVDAPLAANADVAFVRAAVAWATSNFCVDERRYFATGFSSGGYLANALACAGDFGAVVTHAAGGPAPVDDEPDPPSGMWRCKPAAALVLHGVDDPTVPLEEGMGSAERWRVTNRCSPSLAPDVAAPGCEAYVGCDHRVARCFVPGLGHGLASDADVRTAVFFESLR